jgi:hypothetical protein
VPAPTRHLDHQTEGGSARTSSEFGRERILKMSGLSLISNGSATKRKLSAASIGTYCTVCSIRMVFFPLFFMISLSRAALFHLDDDEDEDDERGMCCCTGVVDCGGLSADCAHLTASIGASDTRYRYVPRVFYLHLGCALCWILLFLFIIFIAQW